MRRIYEINTSNPPAPYAIHEEGETEITITPTFENIDKLIYKLNKLIEFSESKSITTDFQAEITKLILEDSKLKFDKSHLESITEKPILTRQMIARRIMPLVSIHGVIYITNKNVYFQPLHAVASKPVKTIHMEDITNIFRRRFELRHVS
jgi:GRAM domain.